MKCELWATLLRPLKGSGFVILIDGSITEKINFCSELYVICLKYLLDIVATSSGSANAAVLVDEPVVVGELIS